MRSRQGSSQTFENSLAYSRQVFEENPTCDYTPPVSIPSGDGNVSSPVVQSIHSPSVLAVPGRRRRRVKRAALRGKYMDDGKQPRAGTDTNVDTGSGTGKLQPSLLLAVFLWYLLGVISISTSKMLLTTSQHIPSPNSEVHSEIEFVGGIPPLLLTVQQLVFGTTFLYALLKLNFMNSSGLQSWDFLLTGQKLHAHDIVTGSMNESSDQRWSETPKLLLRSGHCKYLLFSSFCFSLGFYATNSGFEGASASFVETVKAAEPITSAVLAVSYGLEVLNKQEISSLGAIVIGVLLSTVGNAKQSLSQDGESSLSESFLSFVIIMTANCCFSFRGLYQKLFRSNLRASFPGRNPPFDDLNLQFRMQQLGAGLLLIPTIFFYGPSTLGYLVQVSTNVGFISSGLLFRYLSLALINGIAFTGYNLASTYILSRISVVHHAALNCIRRIFAIVVTSLVFSIPVTLLGATGIIFSFTSFVSFSLAKANKNLELSGNSHLPLAGIPVHIHRA